MSELPERRILVAEYPGGGLWEVEDSVRARGLLAAQGIQVVAEWVPVGEYVERRIEVNPLWLK